MRAIRSMNKQEKKAMDSEIRRRVVEICNQFELDYDTMAVFILFFHNNFTLEEIKDYHRVLMRERKELKEFYEADDKDPDIHFFAMRQKLKEKGIDVEKIRDELMQECGEK